MAISAGVMALTTLAGALTGRVADEVASPLNYSVKVGDGTYTIRPTTVVAGIGLVAAAAGAPIPSEVIPFLAGALASGVTAEVGDELAVKLLSIPKQPVTPQIPTSATGNLRGANPFPYAFAYADEVGNAFGY